MAAPPDSDGAPARAASGCGGARGAPRHRVFIYRGFCVHEGVSTTQHVASLQGMQNLVGTVASLMAVVCLTAMSALGSTDVEYAMEINPGSFAVVPGHLVVGENILDPHMPYAWTYARWVVGLCLFGLCSAIMSMIISVLMYFSLSAVSIPADGHRLLLNWLRYNFMFIVAENVFLISSIVLTIFAMYNCLKLKYPTVVRDRDALVQGVGLGTIFLWVVAMLIAAFQHFAGIVHNLRTMTDESTGQLLYDIVDVAPTPFWWSCTKGQRVAEEEKARRASASRAGGAGGGSAEALAGAEVPYGAR